MPLATRPGKKVPIVLSTDEDLPEEKQPRFLIRMLSAADWEKVAEISEQQEKATSLKEQMDKTLEVIRMGVVGWENMVGADGAEIAFGIGRIKELLSLPELMELMAAVVSQGLKAVDKKKFESPLPSDTGSSAKSALE